MRRCFLLVVALVSMTACTDSRSPVAPGAVPAASAASAGAPVEMRAETSTQNEFIPLDMVVFVSCAAGGVGESVHLVGTLHVRSHVTRDGQGGFHLSQHFQPQRVTGTGATTGDRYQGNGVTRSNTKMKAGMTHTSVNNFRIIGQGAGNNHLVHETLHVTVSTIGVVTTERYKLSVECK